MNILMKVLTGLAVVVGVLILIGFLLPNTVHVERSITINATPNEVFAWVNDLKVFNKWSPWAHVDPNTRYTYEGPSSGVGAKMIWVSDHPGVGSGSQEIITSEPDRRVEIALDIGDQGSSTAHYDLQPEGSTTIVTWGFDTDFGYDILGRYFGLMMDNLVGTEYEKGLATLKELIEGQPSSAP